MYEVIYKIIYEIYQGIKNNQLDLIIACVDDNHIALSFMEGIMAKTFSFAILHFTVAFTVGYLLTGSAMVGGMLAVVEPACNTLVFHFHEKAWIKLSSQNPSR